LSRDGSAYYGPFPSRIAAERFASEFLDFFKVRRCVEDLNPDPSHPGCIYSQMRMCLAPCFQGCSDEEYRGEVGRVVAFLDGAGRTFVRELEEERAQASESLDFEHAAKVHSKIEKFNDVLRSKPDLARNLRDLHAVLVARGGEAKTIIFFRVAGGELRGPVRLALDENVPLPVSLDEQIRGLLDPLDPTAALPDSPPKLPPWEHLSLLARWYYSSFRSGEIVMLDPAGPAGRQHPLPTRALIRACRKVLA
jgi:excinuclease ABC subunit C